MSAVISKLTSGQLTLLIFFAIVAVVVIVGCITSAIRDSITGRYEEEKPPAGPGVDD